MHQHARKLALHTGIIALILIENGFDGWRHGHAFPSCKKGLTGRAGGLKSIVLALPERFAAKRLDERRVGKECVSTGRSGWQPEHQKKKKASYNREIKFTRSN